jgi:hypothetical protein
MPTKLYETAKASLGKHMTLNNAVPAETGCAEAISAVLKAAGVTVPVLGIASTATLYQWLLTSLHFTRIEAPEKGAVIVSPTGHGNGEVTGHTGILGAYGVQYPNEWGIMSNNSDTGLFLELWRLSAWNQYYGEMGQLPVAFFRAL